MSQSNRQLVLDALPGTSKQIQEKTGLIKSTVNRWIEKLIKSDDVYVCKYIRHNNGSSVIACFAAGKKPVGFRARKPKRCIEKRKKANTERMREVRKRAKIMQLQYRQLMRK